MIIRIGKEFCLVCNNCNKTAEKRFKTIIDAADYRRLNGWKIKKTPGGWKDMCPECLMAKNGE